MPKSVKLGDIMKLLTWLDGYSAMAPVDPMRIKRMAEKYSEDHDLSTAWKDVERDVWDIAHVPSSSPDITRLSKILSILKQVLLFAGLIVFTAFIIGTGLGVLSFLGQYASVFFAILFVLVYLVGFGSYFYLDRRLTRRVDNWYDAHAGEISKQRKHIKQVNQRLIDKLAAEIRSKKVDPDKYRFVLMQKDYSNIVVHKDQGSAGYLVTIKGVKRKEGE